MDGREDWTGLAQRKGLLSEWDNGISARGVDGITAVVLVPPQRDHSMLGLKLAAAWRRWSPCAKRAQNSATALAWYSRQNPPTDLEEYGCRHQDVQGMSGLACVGNGCRIIDV